MNGYLRRHGFTLIELMVVVLIIGILTAFAVPRYLRAVESTKADDALGIAQTVASANRMFALAHAGRFAKGTISNACNSGSCAGTGDPANGCDLVRCRYLQAQSWDSKNYDVAAGDGKVDTTCLTMPSIPKIAACVKRKTGAAPGTDITPYNGWGYIVDVNGVLTPAGGAPVPTGF